MSTSPKLGKIKTFFWPIHAGEYKKFIPMFFIFFLISFNYNILRAAKDTLIITAPKSGAETIPYIKTWILLPSAILITYFFTRISNKFSRDKVFYLMIGIFVTFFTIFTTILYPAREFLEPTFVSSKLEKILPLGLHGLISLLRNWPFTLFYVMSELWGTIILSVLFWGFANEVTTISEAKRFYSLFGVGANIASIISGRTTMFLSSNIFNPHIPYGSTAWDQSVLFLTASVVIISFFMGVIFYFLNKKIPSSPKTALNSPSPEKKGEKVKMSLRKNFSYLSKSKYLICIALIVLCYNIAMNLVEVIWKNQVKQLFPASSDYNMYMGKVMIMMGIISTFVALVISGNFLRKFSWTLNALLPPIVVLITGSMFFSFFIVQGSALGFIASLFGSTPLIMSVFFGSLHNCMTRTSKYTLFDATKEMAFIPLDKEVKIKGKAAIDGVGSRIGKSGGSVIHQGLLIIFSTLSATAPYIGFIFFGVVIVWLFAVKALGKQFNILSETHEKATVEKASLENVKDRLTALQEKVQGNNSQKKEGAISATTPKKE
jgi:ATP:ADP antiporter, AAA family